MLLGAVWACWSTILKFPRAGTGEQNLVATVLHCPGPPLAECPLSTCVLSSVTLTLLWTRPFTYLGARSLVSTSAAKRAQASQVLIKCDPASIEDHCWLTFRWRWSILIFALYFVLTSCECGWQCSSIIPRTWVDVSCWLQCKGHHLGLAEDSGMAAPHY